MNQPKITSPLEWALSVSHTLDKSERKVLLYLAANTSPPHFDVGYLVWTAGSGDLAILGMDSDATYKAIEGLCDIGLARFVGMYDIELFIDRTESHYKVAYQDYLPPETKGYVYLTDSLNWLYKIGRSVDPVSRIKAIGVNLPFPLNIKHTIPTDDPVRLERELHQKFSEKRKNGEWFLLDEEDVDFITNMKEFYYEARRREI